ncbi:hypothetical protein CSKR_111918 [Clonorchis sinensis]|uniref:Uncharacterized protein n=1 Tax=Clonorchis sinensis TaxID=79923 RepID=A0A419QHU4_CLOSI|nr:hypothetical protein CSKR_111918 [Clonorchis sinensis]
MVCSLDICNHNPHRIIIIVIDSMTSVFNTDASLPYNHDLFEILIVKKRIKMDGEGTYTRTVPSYHTTHRLHEGWDTARLPKPRQGKSRGRGRVRTTDLPVSKFAL